ncbi:MAG: bifunctional nuclease family protein [Chloroflexota bacterium]
MIQVMVRGLGVAPPSDAPLLLLKEVHGERMLPVGIGPLEAQAIAIPLQGVHPPRPMTHDAFVEAVNTLGGHLQRVEIVRLAEGTFYARLMILQAGNEHAIDIRPSDAVALAVRTETPIYVAEDVFEAASVIPSEISEEGEWSEDADESASESEPIVLDESRLRPFREFIDTLDLDDLDPPAGRGGAEPT